MGDLAKQLCHGIGPSPCKPPPPAPPARAALPATPQRGPVAAGARSAQRAAEVTSPLRTPQRTGASAGPSTPGPVLVDSRDLVEQRDLLASQQSSEKSPAPRKHRRTKAQRLAVSRSPSIQPSAAKPSVRNAAGTPAATNGPRVAEGAGDAQRARLSGAAEPCTAPVRPAGGGGLGGGAADLVAAAGDAAAGDGGGGVRTSGRVSTRSARAAAAQADAVAGVAVVGGRRGWGGVGRRSKRAARPSAAPPPAAKPGRGKRRRAQASGGPPGGTPPMLVSDAVLAAVVSPAPPGLETQAAVVALNELRVSRGASPVVEDAPAGAGAEAGGQRAVEVAVCADVHGTARTRRRAAARDVPGGCMHAAGAGTQDGPATGGEAGVGAPSTGGDVDTAEAEVYQQGGCGTGEIAAGAVTGGVARVGGARAWRPGRAIDVDSHGEAAGEGGRRARSGKGTRRGRGRAEGAEGGRLRRKHEAPAVAVDASLEDELSDEAAEAGPATAEAEAEAEACMPAEEMPSSPVHEGASPPRGHGSGTSLYEAVLPVLPVAPVPLERESPQRIDVEPPLLPEAVHADWSPLPASAKRKRKQPAREAPAKGGKRARKAAAAKLPAAAAPSSPPQAHSRRGKEVDPVHSPHTPVRARPRTSGKAPTAEAHDSAPAPSPLRERTEPLALLSMCAPASQLGHPPQVDSGAVCAVTWVCSGLLDIGVWLCRGLAVPRKLRRKAQSARLQAVEHAPGAVVPAFTHYVAEELVLSLHVLLALADGRPIVSMDWLAASIEAGSAVPAAKYLLEDRKAEKKYGLVLKTTLASAKQCRLLDGAASPL